ncbi:MAG TPA: uracil-DNA glycosylase [Gemmatimonadaceae bacterium]|nr:uracil-DNA glycosylase [Gemmatimonadaceae bacterium]
MKSELDKHRAALSACRLCALGDAIRPIVSQAREPRVMLVGQAPGKVEASGGRPFAGRAGRTLFSWFAGIGLDEALLREQMYIAAVTRCFPGAHPSGRGDRVPSPGERENCASWLASEIGIIRPRLIIPVGRLAIDALLGPMPLDRAIGREHRLAGDSRWAAAGAPRAVVVPLPHPSGASSWIHAPGHRELLHDSLRIIRARWAEVHKDRRAA